MPTFVEYKRWCRHAMLVSLDFTSIFESHREEMDLSWLNRVLHFFCFALTPRDLFLHAGQKKVYPNLSWQSSKGCQVMLDVWTKSKCTITWQSSKSISLSAKYPNRGKYIVQLLIKTSTDELHDQFHIKLREFRYKRETFDKFHIKLSNIYDVHVEKQAKYDENNQSEEHHDQWIDVGFFSRSKSNISLSNNRDFKG